MAHQEIVLVPLDGSGLAESALAYADAIARAKKASLRLLSVIERDDGALFGASHEVRDYMGRVRREGMAEYLEVMARDLSARGIVTSTKVVVGSPAEEIIAEADEVDAAMIVMATHGRGGLDRWLLGSVADKVMRRGSRPALLVRPSEPESSGRWVPLHLHMLMVPLDGSTPAEQALQPAAELAVAFGAHIALVRVEPQISTLATGFDYLPDLSDADEAASEAAAAYLGQARRLLPESLPVETLVPRGRPIDKLLEFVHDRQVDLVVMATHGRGGLRRLVAGSIADRLVRSGAPVLLIRPATVPATRSADGKRADALSSARR